MMGARVAAVCLLAGLPWTVVVSGGALTLVFPFGLVDPGSLHLTTTVDYTYAHTRGLPGYLLAWPVGAALYALAVGSVLGGALFGREDRRVTAALLVLAGGAHLFHALGLSQGLRTVALPAGTLACWAVVWWFDRAAFRCPVAPVRE